MDTNLYLLVLFVIGLVIQGFIFRWTMVMLSNTMKDILNNAAAEPNSVAEIKDNAEMLLIQNQEIAEVMIEMEKAQAITQQGLEDLYIHWNKQYPSNKIGNSLPTATQTQLLRTADKRN